MKKIINKANFALIALMASAAPAMAANSGVCALVAKLGGVLDYIRLFAFVGAGFLIAAWAWDYIKGGKVEIEDLKKKGMALLVGCFLLFFVGAILSFLISATGPGGSFDCYTELGNW